MRCVMQDVADAKVTVDGAVVGRIERGMLVYFGVQKGDTEQELVWITDKIAKERIFHDANGKTNLSILDVHGEILLVSQFTLCADLRKGNRPSYDYSEEPGKAESMYRKAIDLLKAKGIPVQHGSFGAHMLVSYTNIGPQTFVLEKTPERTDSAQKTVVEK